MKILEIIEGNVFIIGAGRHAAETFHIYQEQEAKKVLAFFQDNNTEIDKKLCEKPVLDIKELKTYIANKDDIKILCAIGSPKRKLLIERLNQFCEWNYDTIVSKTAIYEPKNVKILEGTSIAQGCILTINIEIGKHTIINIGCTINHDCKIGNFVTISPSVKIAGNVIIEDEVFIGIGATIIEKITIGKGSFIAAGAVITKNVAPYTMVGGVPAKFIKNISH
jgi:acetyltransferase EpsM